MRVDTGFVLGLPAEDLERAIRRDPPSEPARLIEALRAEASLFYHSDSTRARDIAARALKVAKISGDTTALGWGHRAMAEAHLFSGRMREADVHYVAAAKAWREARAPKLLGELLTGHIHVLSILGRDADAETAAREARRNLEQAGHTLYLAKLAMNLGNIHFQHEHHRDALDEYDRASALFRTLRAHDEATVGLEINRAVALTQLDRDEEALGAFRAVERECQQRDYELLLAQIRMNAAYVHALRADFGLALRTLSLATDYFERIEHPAFLASCMLNRAEIYNELNLHKEALALTERARPLFAQEGMAFDEGLALSLGALSSLALGNLPAARGGMRMARRIFERLANPARVALMQLMMAEIALRRRHSMEAETFASMALDSFKELGLVHWEAVATVFLSRLEAPRESPHKQIRRLRTILKRIPERIYPIAAYQILETLGEAQERAGAIQAATRSYCSAIDRFEDVRVRIPTEESKIAFLRDKTGLYDRLLSIELSRRHPSVAKLFDWMERARAQSLWDRFREPMTDAEALPRDRKATALRRHLSWLHARLSRLELGSTQERAQAAEVRGKLLEAEDAWSRFLRERAERDAQNASPQSSGTASIAEIAKRLPKGWGFLSYHISERCSLAVAITREGTVWRQLKPGLHRRLHVLGAKLDLQWDTAAMLRASVRKTAHGHSMAASLSSGMESSMRGSTDMLLRELHGLLWRPIEEAASSGPLHWIVSLHGPIHRIPLHALLGRDGYVIESTDLSYAPSARIWSRMSKPRKLRGSSAYIAGVPSPELPAVAMEVRRIAEGLAGWTKGVDLSPTRESLRTRGQAANLIHIAAHGMLRPDNPAYSYIELSDGPLFVHDLKDLRFPASTVVLSACSAGRGAAPTGDEWIGLARGFLRAGASTVVASLWPIEDEPTLELMDLFYERMVAGHSPPLALGESMRELMCQRPHPWHWASFAAVGGV
jgi:tetratricopeptide (TPR) repeat protein